MFRLKMENITIIIVVLNLVVYFLDCALVEGKTLDPIYWNSSNPMFRSGTSYIDVSINDRLDIICPRRGRDDGEKLFYFKLYLVNEENFRKCNTTGARRLITCDVPEREKKYTFYFQEISPSPWGLEFDPSKSYYVVSTSDGSKSGLDGQKGGVCTRFNMKIEMKIHAANDFSVKHPKVVKPKHPKTVAVIPVKSQKKGKQDFVTNQNFFPEESGGIDGSNNGKDAATAEQSPSAESDDGEQVGGNGLVIGIALGACAVIFIVLLSFLGYKLYRRRRQNKKYQSPPITPTRGATPLQQVTLLPIAPHAHHGHHHHHGRIHSDHDRHRSATLSTHSDMRPPPSYTESFLDNGGPVVAV